MKLERAEEGTWWDVARRCDYATFFHTPLWHELTVRTFPGWRDVSLQARLDDGTRAVVPLLERVRRPFRVFRDRVSTFAGCYGGPIADGPLGAADRTRLYEAAGHALGWMALNGNPLAPDGAAPRGFRASRDSSHLLRLDAPLEELVRRFSHGHRRAVGVGRRKGVTTRLAESLSDYRAYYSVYEATLARWGEGATSRYPWALFEHGHALADRHPANLALWLGELDGSVVAGAWVFYWNRHAVYWHGASDQAGRRASAAPVVIVDAIEDAQRRGCGWFDFNPSGGHASVAAFKTEFGTDVMPFARYTRAPAALRPLRGVLARLGSERA